MTSLIHHLRAFAAALLLVLCAMPAFAATATITAVNGPNGVYGVNATIDITVTFTVPVTVVGAPTLTLATGPTSRVVSIASGAGSGSGTITLHFPYTVQSGDISSDLDYIATAPQLQLPAGATIQDASMVNADLTLAPPGFAGSLGANAFIVIDTVPATVQSVTTTKPPGLYGVGIAIPITVTFSKPVTTSTTPTLTLNTAPNAVVNYSSGSGSAVLTFVYTTALPQISNHLDYLNTSALAGAISNFNTSGVTPATLTLPAVGATGSLGANSTIAINTNADAIAPTVLSITASSSNGTYVTGQTLTLLVTMSEPVNVTGAPLLQLNDIGSGPTDPVATYTTGSGSSVLSFAYPIASTDATRHLDELSASALQLNGGNIQDIQPNTATLTVPAPGASGSLAANRAIAVNLNSLPSGKPLAATVTGITTPKGGCGLGSGLSLVLATLALALHAWSMGRRGRR